MSKAKYRLMIISSVVLFLTGFSLLILAGRLHAEGQSDSFFNIMGALFFIILIGILVLFLSHEEALSTYHAKKKEDLLKKGVLSSYVKTDSLNLILKRLDFHGFTHIKEHFMVCRKFDRLFGNADFYVKINTTHDYEKSIKDTHSRFKDVRLEGPSYGKLVRNYVLILTIVDHLEYVDLEKIREMISHCISLEQFGDVFIPMIYETSGNRYIFRNIRQSIQYNRFYVGTQEFKKYILGSPLKNRLIIKMKRENTHVNQKV